MTTTIADGRQSTRASAERDELAGRIRRATPGEGCTCVAANLDLYRYASASDPHFGMSRSAFCVIAQGGKQVLLGAERFRYDPNHYLISTMGLPTVSHVDVATPDEPYLGVRLTLDPAVVTSVIVESGRLDPEPGGGGVLARSVSAIAVSTLDAELLNATLRLVRLAESPREYAMLAPLVVREIVYRLLVGEQGDRLRHVATLGGQAHRMARAVRRLRDDYDKPLRIEAIAREVDMSPSGFHAHFKAVTAMSPLQFQKQLRLQEARRLMLTERLDAAGAGYRVGYDDPAYFSREYKRHFGEPPMRDVERLRGGATAM